MDRCPPIWHLWAWEETAWMMALVLDITMALEMLHCQQDLACRVPVEGEVLVGSVVAIL